MMKKLCLLLSLLLVFSLLGACNKAPTQSTDANSSAITAPLESEQSGTDSDDSDAVEDASSTDTTDESDPTDTTDTEQNDTDSYTEIEDPSSNETGIDATELFVYNSQKPLSTTYAGMSGTIYHAYGFMKDEKSGRVYTDKMMDLELDRLEETGMRYCRTRYHSQWMWNSKSEAYNWSSDRFGYFCDYAEALQQRDIDVLLQVGWHFGFVTKLDSYSIGEVQYLQGDQADRYGESTGYDFTGMTAEEQRITKSARRFGYFYAETLRQLRARGIHNISHLVYMVEPSNDYSGREAGHANKEYVFFCEAMMEKLKEEQVADTVKHMGPNEVSVNGDSLLKYTLEQAPDLFDVLSCHYYPNISDTTTDVLYDAFGPTLDAYKAHAEQAGIWGKKEFWLDEFDVSFAGNDKGVSNSWAGLQAAYGALIAQQKGMNNVIFWQLFDQLWTDSATNNSQFTNGIHMTGAIPSLFNSSTPYAQWYSLGLFTRYNSSQNGTVYNTSFVEAAENYDGLYIGAVQLEDGSWTITVLNLNLDRTNICIRFDKAINQTLYRHVCVAGLVEPTPQATLADADKGFVDVKDRLYDTIPSGAIAVYTGIKG